MFTIINYLVASDILAKYAGVMEIHVLYFLHLEIVSMKTLTHFVL